MEQYSLYDKRFEHDACGVGFVVNVKGEKSYSIVRDGIEILENLAHRGATGAEPNTGDGAGILIQLPHEFISSVFAKHVSKNLKPGSYLAGNMFVSREVNFEKALGQIETIASEEGLSLLAVRDVAHNPEGLGFSALESLPVIKQVLFEATDNLFDIEVRAFCFRKRAEHSINGIYFCSLSSKTIVYKGMLTGHQLCTFYEDLSNEELVTALALVHSRFSTNTFPSWSLAHPYRFIAHNGEINTLMGNRNWMRAREKLLASDRIPGNIERLLPMLTPGASDSASFDEALELLHIGGRPLYHAILMMIPEAWERHESMDEEKRAFYRYHACLQEPWDGPAAIAFTDGEIIGAQLDRNGLRPARYWELKDGRVILASEVGVLEIDPSEVIRKGRLEPGRILLIDTKLKRIVSDDEVKQKLAKEKPYKTWLSESLIHLDELPRREMLVAKRATAKFDEMLFGYSEEDLRIILAPMAISGAEPIGSMGNDSALAVLSKRDRLIYDYFFQLFAQVTNPPLDAIREELVTSLNVFLGPEGNLFEPTKESARKIALSSPILSNDDLAKILYIDEEGGISSFKAKAIDALFEVGDLGEGLKKGIINAIERALEAISNGCNFIVLSDRYANRELAPIPSLLMVGALHHHLVKERLRTKVALVVETGDAREVHHMACLLGYGASAINPYVAFEAIEDMVKKDVIKDISVNKAIKNYIKALNKGILKVMSKMGISTVASYTGAQVFEIIGLSDEVVELCFEGSVSRIKGASFDALARDIKKRHDRVFFERSTELAYRELEISGEYQYRREGEYHLFNPKTVFKLQHSTRAKRFDIFKNYTKLVDDQSKNLATLRGLLELKPRDGGSIPIDEVEPIESIIKRFSTGAMSYGSISKEAHETLAIAMNRLGAKSNTGEGGEDPDRFYPDPNGDLRRSAIKQVASGRFGVTSEYLVNADALQIKIAQGAKPGEGGQLPGHKVYPWIAKTRHSTPGVGLISPPPHHDIYSIEDLAELIFDLKNANPKADVHVKLVAEVGVGTIAAGVAKAKSDLILISGHDGGTGASPLSSIKHAGVPWELGIAETQQILVANGLRDRVVLQVDGQLKTGRDVIVATLLGAEEYGFATAPLVVSGCIMMRVCHLDTCPVGIATQNPELRKRFSGKAEFVVNFFEFIAQEVREYLAYLGFRSIEEAVGRVECLEFKPAIDNYSAKGLDLSPILRAPEGKYVGSCARHKVKNQDHKLDEVIDNKLIELAQDALLRKEKVFHELEIKNKNRACGTMLGYEVTKRFGGEGLPDDTITFRFRGSAGQSFGAFCPPGITLELIGDANDYLAKGLSGAKIIVKPPEQSSFLSHENVIAGNVIAYGATAGELYIGGLVGERFCVRNSGAIAVCEGVGDHGCEYMTGGRAVILGKTGRNFGAGMSGGIAYVYDRENDFPSKLNTEMVAIEPLDEDDIDFLKLTLQEFSRLTGSMVAREILNNFDSKIFNFKKVMPRDLRRVLDAEREAQERGESAIEIIMAAAHG